MEDFILFLDQQSRHEKVAITLELDEALTKLDQLLAEICAAVQIEFDGPFVGVETPEAHRLAVRAHEWKIHEPSWSMKICTTAPAANSRAEWAVQSAGRLRKQIVVKALPAFFAGFAQAIDAAGKSEMPEAKHVQALAQHFNV